MKIIIQTSDRGMENLQLTYNKPKCLIPINNLPIILHLFELFKNEEFFIIGNYKYEVLEKYLKTFASEYNYKLFKTERDGITSGIKNCLDFIDNNEPFIIYLCNFILPKTFKLPIDLTKNYIGISKEYEFNHNQYAKKSSKDSGIVGFFVFKNKEEIKDIDDGLDSLEDYTNDKNIEFESLELHGQNKTKIINTYNQNIVKDLNRPFNYLEWTSDGKVIKSGTTQRGIELAKNESNWYKFIKEKTNFKDIPNIYNYNPIIMDKIDGHNIFEYTNIWNFDKKKMVLKQIVEIINNLHNQNEGIIANIEDIRENYIEKTFNRLNIVQKLIPFTDKEYITINNKDYKNIFFYKSEFENLVKDNFYNTKMFKIIHGECTFSNILYNEVKQKPILVDPRGYFGKTKVFGDHYYDWAKLYYSLVGNFDQFHNKNYLLKINNNKVELNIESNGFEKLEDYFFELLPDIDRKKIKLLHCIIWLSLTTYVWENYDSVCGSFYNGIIKYGEIDEK